MIKQIFLLLLAVFFVCMPFACKDKDFSKPTPRYLLHKTVDYAGSLAFDWVTLTHNLIKTNNLNAPNAARAYAYLGLTLWESVYNGIPEANSLAGQLQDYDSAVAIDVNTEYDWGIVLSAAMRDVLPMIIDNINDGQRTQINKLADDQEAAMMEKDLLELTREDSKALGKKIALKIIDRIKVDGRDIIRNIIPSVPKRDSSYKWYYDQNVNPNTKPVEPLWGTIRTFVVKNSQACEGAIPYVYAELANSPFYLDAKEVYEIPGTDDQKRIAFHWEDGPGRTSCEVGHWMNITKQLLELTEHNLADCAKAFCLAGITASDALCTVWYIKYTYYLLRPVTYITEVIDGGWKPLVNTPASPDYTSSSAALGAAIPIVLIPLFGDVSFTDRTHLGSALYTPINPPPNAPFILPERYFASISKAGEEAVESGIVGGIQFRRACEQGRQTGQCVGNAVLAGLKFGF
ncbi:MAG: vanadium-dependent haloperoxidase [Bacteroidetes bacterium]|nr:vanadium-dependent haloperoxidase [Bacteroidota bacterium]